MRSFDILFVLIFLIFFILTSLASYFNLKNCFSDRFRKSSGMIYSAIALGILIGFAILYIYPFHPGRATHIPVYFYFNVLLFSFLIFNIPMSLSLITHLIFGRGRTPSPFSMAGTILSVSVVFGMLYGAFAGSRQLSVERHTLVNATVPEGFHQFRIVQISDVHIGGIINSDRFLRRVVETVEVSNPDLILFTGDLVNNFAAEMEGKTDFLKALSSVAPAYSILGNHDYGNYTRWDDPAKKLENFNMILQCQEQSGLQLLNNDRVVIHRDSDSIFLAGVENWGHPPFPQYADLDRAINGIPPQAFTVLMTHDPAHWESLPAGKHGIDLTLSGHTHGMQWGIKLAGIPFSLASLTRDYWGGWYSDEQAKLYVNRGLGTVGMPWRLDMPAEVTVITLERSEVD